MDKKAFRAWQRNRLITFAKSPVKKVEDQDALMERLFEAMKNRRLKIVLRDVFGLSYEYLLEVSGFGCDRIVDVVITKKTPNIISITPLNLMFFTSILSLLESISNCSLL